jgi:GTP1/Obg family GTP-binding protein
MNWKECGKKLSWPYLQNYHRIHLKELSKTKKKVRVIQRYKNMMHHVLEQKNITYLKKDYNSRIVSTMCWHHCFTELRNVLLIFSRLFHVMVSFATETRLGGGRGGALRSPDIT